MNKIFLVIAAGAALIFAIAGAFYIFVGQGLPISENASGWSDFGSYFGGVAGAMLSFISTVLIVHSINIQNNQISDAQSETLKRDLLAHISAADSEISYWLQRKLLSHSIKDKYVEFGDVVWGLVDYKNVVSEDFQLATRRLHKLVCQYCEALALYRTNVDGYFIYKHHQSKAESLLKFLRDHEKYLGQMAGPSLEFCQMHLEGRNTGQAMTPN